MEARNAPPQAPASAGAEPQKTTEPAATTGVTAGSSGIGPITEIGQVGDIGLELRQNPTGKTRFVDSGGAESGAVPEIPRFCALLGFADCWKALSPATRAAVSGLPKKVLDELAAAISLGTDSD